MSMRPAPADAFNPRPSSAVRPAEMIGGLGTPTPSRPGRAPVPQTFDPPAPARPGPMPPAPAGMRPMVEPPAGLSVPAPARVSNQTHASDWKQMEPSVRPTPTSTPTMAVARPIPERIALSSPTAARPNAAAQPDLSAPGGQAGQSRARPVVESPEAARPRGGIDLSAPAPIHGPAVEPPGPVVRPAEAMRERYPLASPSAIHQGGGMVLGVGGVTVGRPRENQKPLMPAVTTRDPAGPKRTLDSPSLFYR